MKPGGTDQDSRSKFALSSTDQGCSCGADHPNPVAIIGVGNMGGGMARRLLSLGWPVRVCDIDPVKVKTLESFGALALDMPAQAAMSSIAVLVVVVDAAETEDVLFGPSGVASVLQPGQTVFLCPTLAPADVGRLAARLLDLGVNVVDAPMSGGPMRAQDGSMSLMLAGASEVLAQHQALLEALASQRFVISSRVGDAARTKLVNNLAAGINLVGAAEVLALAQKMGLDVSRTLDVIEHSSGQSWIGSDRLRRAVAGDYAPRAHMTLLQKDTRLALDAAQAVGFSGPLGKAARDVFAQASAGGLAGQDDAALFKWLSAAPEHPG
jgi:3-hydroxyisobutyrate dehydrogenase-like beta-hydroxyacid dehydrogenase